MTPVVSQPSAMSAEANPMIEQLKSQMADIVEPTAVEWWPLAWGWWVAVALVTLITLWLIIHCISHYRHNLYRRQALRLLKQQTFNDQHEQAQFLMRLSKQVALKAYPSARSTIAKAFGEEWLSWLNGTTRKPLFNTQAAKAWQNHLYKRNQMAASSELTLALKRWIKRHKRRVKVTMDV